VPRQYLASQVGACVYMDGIDKDSRSKAGIGMGANSLQ